MSHNESIIACEYLWIMNSMSILEYTKSHFVSEIIINEGNPGFGIIVITILDFTNNWYYNIIANMAHAELTIAFQPLWITRIMNIIHYIVSHLSEIILNKRNPGFSTIIITVLDFTYNWYYKIVANIANTEIIISCQPLCIMGSMSILHYIKHNSMYEIIIDQRNPGFGIIVIKILDFTYNWYYKIAANMAYAKLIIACQPLWIMMSMHTIYCIKLHFISKIIINLTNNWFGTIIIIILDFTYIMYYRNIANMAHIQLLISCQPLRFMGIIIILNYIKFH